MLYTQTSLSLVYNLERVSESLQCYSATYQFGIVAWLRLEPNSYSTKLYSLHRRCSFGPVAVALGQLSVVRAVCRFSAPWSCLYSAWFAPWSWWPPDVAVAACWSCSFGWGYGNDATTPCSSDHGAVLCGVSCALCDERGDLWWWWWVRPQSGGEHVVCLDTAVSFGVDCR